MVDGEATKVRMTGPFLEIAENIWVNAAHVAAIVPIDSIKTTQLQCRVYVAGPSLGGGHVLAWNSPMGAAEMAAALTMAQADAHQAWGFWEEKGRLRALDESDLDD